MLTPPRNNTSWPNGVERKNSTINVIEHLRRVIELDTNHAAARSAAGYMQSSRKWQRHEDTMKSNGYILYKGEWKLPQEIELLERKRQQDAKEHEWFSKLTKYKADIVRGSPQKQDEAIQRLRELTDTSALPAITSGLKNESSPPLLKAYMEVVSRIGYGASLHMLVSAAIEHNNDDIREYAFDLLRKRKNPDVTAMLIGELRNKSNARVNRAGLHTR